MLELRPNCELCDVDLPPDAADARICSYECTFCAACVEHVLHDVCPNCGGGFPAAADPPAAGVAQGDRPRRRPPGARRRHTAYTRDEIAAFTETLRVVLPEQR
jgi:hypothetical protein